MSEKSKVILISLIKGKNKRTALVDKSGLIHDIEEKLVDRGGESRIKVIKNDVTHAYLDA